jgi:hypothetical protein
MGASASFRKNVDGYTRVNESDTTLQGQLYLETSPDSITIAAVHNLAVFQLSGVRYFAFKHIVRIFKNDVDEEFYELRKELDY